MPGTQHAEGIGTAFFEFPGVAFAHKGEVLHSFLISNALRVGILVEGHAVEVSAGQGEFGTHRFHFFGGRGLRLRGGLSLFVVVLVAGAEGESCGGEQEHTKDFSEHKAECLR